MPKRSAAYQKAGNKGYKRRKVYSGTAAVNAAMARDFARGRLSYGRATGELKGVDTILTYSPIIGTTGTNAGITVLNLIVPGSASYNRVGRKTKLKSVRVRAEIEAAITAAAATGDTQGAIVRCALVWDKQPSGAIPTFDSIFGVSDQVGTESSLVLAPQRYDNTQRFKVLKDECMEFNPSTAIANGDVDTQRKVLEFYLKLSDLESTYSGQTSPQTIADISSGALYIIWRSSFNTGGVFQASVLANSFARLRFVDA